MYKVHKGGQCDLSGVNDKKFKKRRLGWGNWVMGIKEGIVI